MKKRNDPHVFQQIMPEQTTFKKMKLYVGLLMSYFL